MTEADKAARAESPARQFRRLIESDRAILAPGVFDATSARLVERAGFECVHASGGAIARSMGFPDLGLIGLGEMIGRIASIIEACAIPVVADADTGYGNALNVQRTVREFERAGVAGLHIEDQHFPKRCGYYGELGVVPADEMVGKIRAALDARQDDDVFVIARTDALTVEGFDAAVARAQRYAEAGADMVFVEALECEAQIEALARAVPQPKMYNMFCAGQPPLVPVERLAALGYRFVVFPSDVQRAAIHAMTEVLAAIRRDGHSAAMQNRLASGTERDGLVDLDAYLDLSRRYSG